VNLQDDSFDLAELSERADVSQRTVRYYIQQGLLPSPETRGPGAHYGPEHLDRLRLIRTLQREHLPLAEIRRRLEELDPDAIRELVELDSKRPVSEAQDYIRSVLSEGTGMLSARSVRESTPPSVTPDKDPFGKTKSRKPGARSQWDRIPLGPDVELHVRRPLDREQNKQVERLLDAARHIFEDE
jgi:DNA-binding transcriptional MerR regulator